jgi:hypothetical protein
MSEVTEDVVETQSMDDFMGEQFDVLEADSSEESAPVIEEQSASEEAHTDDVVDETTESNTESEGSEPDNQTITAPQSMSAKDREAFYTLPPESQQWISDRVKSQEADYTRKTMEVAEQRKMYDKLEQAIAPRRQQFAMDGMDDGTAIGQLLALSDYAASDPVGFSRYLLNQRGIPISALTEPDVENHVDPQMLAMQNRLQGFENHFSQQQAQQSEQEGAVVSGVIDGFASDNPFYGELESEMIPIVSALRESKPGLTSEQYLATAYKMAIAANDEVAAKINVDIKAKSEAERISKAKKQSSAAKRAGGTRVSSTGVLPAGAAKAKSVDDFIGALVDDRMTA